MKNTLLLLFSLSLLVPGCAVTTQPDPEQRRIIDTTSYRIVNEKTEPPILKFRQRLADQKKITKDPFDYETHWFQSTISSEKSSRP